MLNTKPFTDRSQQLLNLVIFSSANASCKKVRYLNRVKPTNSQTTRRLPFFEAFTDTKCQGVCNVVFLSEKNTPKITTTDRQSPAEIDVVGLRAKSKPQIRCSGLR